MDVLRAWVITLVSITILCTIVEKFAPQGSLARLVKLVCGLAVTVVIAIPAINLLRGELKIENVAWGEYIKLSEGELKKRIEILEKQDYREMLELYRESLILDIKSRFQGEGDFVVTNVDVVLHENPNDKSFGMIRALYLTLEPGSMNKSKILTNANLNYIKSELVQAFGIDRNSIVIDQSRFTGGG